MVVAEGTPAAAATAAEKVLLVVNIHHESQICRNLYFWHQNLGVQAPAEFHDGDEADRRTNTDD